MKKVFTVEKEELASVAESFLKEVVPLLEKKPLFVALHGDLGAGKTAFVKEAAKLLGVEEELISPTFILKKEYEVHLSEVEKLVHVDAYRLASGKEGKVLKLSDDRHPKTLVFVEWAENLGEEVWDAELTFEYVREEARRITVTIHGKD